MSCLRCPKWVINIFVCLKCGTVFRWKHRDAGNSPVAQALGRGAKCPKCNSQEFKLNE